MNINSIQSASSTTQPVTLVPSQTAGQPSTFRSDLLAFAVTVVAITVALLVLRELTSLMVHDLWRLSLPAGR